MGYLLNELGNLPIDDEVNFYIFVVNGRFADPLYRVVEDNFANIAKTIGSHAVIARGLDPHAFHRQISQAYFGENAEPFTSLLPALIITNNHPRNASKTAIRLVVPLRDVEPRFGDWHRFFALMSDFVQGKSDEFVKLFEAQESALEAANRYINLKPGMFGISINGNELLKWFAKRRGAISPQ